MTRQSRKIASAKPNTKKESARVAKTAAASAKKAEPAMKVVSNNTKPAAKAAPAKKKAKKPAQQNPAEKQAGLYTAFDAAATPEQQIEMGQEVAAIQVEQALTMSKEQFTKMLEDAQKGLDEAMTMSQAYMEALGQSGGLLSRSGEDMLKSWMGFNQTMVERSIETGRAMMGVKTLRDLTELQSRLIRDLLDEAFAETARLNEAALKATNVALEPLAAQVNEAWERSTSRSD